MSLNFDDLYALRLYHLDTIHDEFKIIQKLKIELFNSGIRNMDQIDETLVNFYKQFNMEWINKEMISSVALPVYFNNFMNMINHIAGSQQNVYQEEPEEPSQNNPEDDSSLDSDDDIPELESDIDSDSELDEIIDETLNSTPIFNIPPINLNQNIMINMNSFNMFLSQVLTSQFNPPSMEDVKQYNGIKKEDMDKLEEYNIKEDSEDSCCICMMNFDKETKMVKLPCGHEFHSECIKKWFTDSNNVCPICKTTYGEAQFLYNGVTRNS